MLLSENDPKKSDSKCSSQGHKVSSLEGINSRDKWTESRPAFFL